MESKLEPNQYFFENSHSLTEDQLRQNNLQNPAEGLIRFFNRLNDFVFGVQAFDDDHSVHLFYADHKKEFRAIGIFIPIDYELANELVLVLAREIVVLNNELDIFDVYNTLQFKRETALEVLGYFTVDPNDIKNGTLITVGQIVKPVWKLDRVDFMKKMFKDIIDNESLDPKNKIYLMVDDVSGYKLDTELFGLCGAQFVSAENNAFSPFVNS